MGKVRLDHRSEGASAQRGGVLGVSGIRQLWIYGTLRRIQNLIGASSSHQTLISIGGKL